MFLFLWHYFFLLCMNLGKQVACTIEHYHHMLIVDDILDKRSRNFTRSGRASRALCAGPWWKRTNWHSQKSTSNYEKMPADRLPRSFAFINKSFQSNWTSPLLFYTGIVVLKNCPSKEKYCHFLLFITLCYFNFVNK